MRDIFRLSVRQAPSVTRLLVHSKSGATVLFSSEQQPSRWFGSWSDTISKRDMAELEDRICGEVAASTLDPVLKQPLSQLQWLHKRIAVSDGEKDKTTLQMLLRLPSLLHPSLDELKALVQTEAEKRLQTWLEERSHSDLTANVNVEAIATKPTPMMARLVEDHEALLASLGPGLASVSHFVAVYSCKGGVGKSTVAVNLAFELAAQGGRVGLLDLDLYGPSLPVLVKPDDVAIRRSPRGSGVVYPIQHGNVKLLSLGFVNTHSGVPGSGQENGASVMKGPMAVKVVSQLLKGTDWGDLDVLILDLPPGTGDVQLAVLQQLQLSGAVAVSTPSKLAATDTRKGMEMFTSLGVPTLAVVENMAYFEDEDGRRHFPFGNGFAGEGYRDLTESLPVVQLPISMATNDANEDGEPLTLSRPKEATKELTAFQDLAAAVTRELLQLQYGSSSETNEEVLFGTNSFDVATTTLSLDKAKGEEKFTVRLFSDSEAVQEQVAPALLRSRDPKTGDTILDSPFLNQVDDSASSQDPMVTVTKLSGKRSPSIIPTKVERRGRYGFAVEWGDGATIIYSMRSLAKAAGGVLASRKKETLDT